MDNGARYLRVGSTKQNVQITPDRSNILLQRLQFALFLSESVGSNNRDLGIPTYRSQSADDALEFHQLDVCLFQEVRDGRLFAVG